MTPSLASAETIVDLTAANSSGTIDGAIFSNDMSHPTGTGVIEPFVRLQAKGVESGYNTDGTLQYDTKAGLWTHAIQVSEIPEVTVNGVTYREFFLDINESKPGTLLSLDQLKIHLEDSGSLTGYPENFSAPVYNMDTSGDNWVKLNYELNNGSGSGDLRVLIPTALFGTDASKYLYLYSQFGTNFSSDAGFEEWYVRQANSTQTVPEPTTIALVLIGAGGFSMLRRRKP